MGRHDYRVAIIGAGPIGCATAAFLSEQGVAVAMWSPTGHRLAFQRDRRTASFETAGCLHASVSVAWLTDMQDIADYSHVFICLPGSIYESVLTQLSDHWRSGQTVVVSGALSLVPLWLRNEARSRGADITVAGWGTTLTTAHFLADGRLHMNSMRHRIDMAWLAGARSMPGLRDVLSDCNLLFGERFVRVESLLASALANINPIAHAAEVMPNLTRMERGERWQLFDHFTGAVARMADALDRERLALAECLGFALPTLVEHYHRSYHVPVGPLNEMARAIESAGKGPLGPDRLDHRYVLEDVPFGLVMHERLAQAMHVDCATLSSCITLFEAIYQRPFRDQNFLMASLLPDESALPALLASCKSDSAAA